VIPVADVEKVRHRTAWRLRLYPTRSQAAALDGQGHAARALWNLLHEWYTCRDGGIARRPLISDIDRQLRDARAHPLPGWEWLADLPAQATQQVLKHYLNAWDRFFNRTSEPPRFRKRSGHTAVDVPQASALKVARLSRHWGELNITLVGRVRFRWTRALPGISGVPGRITGARLVKDPLGWHICFRIEASAVAASANPGAPVGIDRGVVHTMALSTGELLDMPSPLTPGEQRRLQGLERKSARQLLALRQQRAHDANAVMSRRHRRTYEQIAELRARQARRRSDWLHKATTRLAKSHGVVVVEDLRIRNLTRSARGTTELPGTNVRAKTGLNRSILSMAWGKAGQMLAYKCRMQGGVLVKVDARNSSVECARCGDSSPGNRLDQATFRCVACRHAANADTNAAQVLLGRGLTALSGATPGCGGTAREAGVTLPHREPLPFKPSQPVMPMARSGASSRAR
jgi:putative transposase